MIKWEHNKTVKDQNISKEGIEKVDSSSLSPQEAVACLDPLIQPFDDQDGNPVYYKRESSIFYIPANIINEQTIDKTNKCFSYMKRFSGILYALIATMLFACSNFLLKQLKLLEIQ